MPLQSQERLRGTTLFHVLSGPFAGPRTSMAEVVLLSLLFCARFVMSERLLFEKDKKENASTTCRATVVSLSEVNLLIHLSRQVFVVNLKRSKRHDKETKTTQISG